MLALGEFGHFVHPLLEVLEGASRGDVEDQDHGLRLFVELVPDVLELQIPAGVPDVHPEVLKETPPKMWYRAPAVQTYYI